MSTQQSLRHNRIEQGGTQAGLEISPRFARVHEVQLAQIATQEALVTLHGIHIADAAGAAVAAREMQNPIVTVDTRPENAGNENSAYLTGLAAAVQADRRPEFVPASQEVQEYAAAQQQPVYAGQNGFVPQSTEVQQYTQYAQQMAQPTPGMQQPVPAPSSLGAQVNGF